jgi:hypothetical protein
MDKLERYRIPPEDIVLVFHPTRLRPLAGFAAG